MSYKIYTGFMLKSAKTLEDALTWADSIRGRFNHLANAVWADSILTKAIIDYDDNYHTNNGAPPTVNHIDDAYKWISDMEMHSKEKGTTAFSNIGMQLCFYPVKVGNRKRIIGVAFIDNQVMLDEFFKLDEVLDYAYFTTGDRVASVNAKEWEARKETWLSVFNENVTVAERMFSITLVSDGLRIIFKETLEDYFKRGIVPTYEERVERLASMLVGNNRWLHMKPSYGAMLDYYNSAGYKADIQTMKMEISIPETIDFSELIKEVE